MPRSTTTYVKSRAIEVATELVRRQGSEKFRLSDVAKEMGMTHAALYNYFKSKDDLLDSINAEWLYRIDEELEGIIHQDTTVLIRIRCWFMRLYEMKKEKAQLDIHPYAAFIDATIKEKPYIHKHLTIQFRQLNQLCDEAVAAYDVKVDSEKLTSLLLEATIMFHHPKFVKDTAGSDRKDDLSQLLDVLLRGFFGNSTPNNTCPSKYRNEIY